MAETADVIVVGAGIVMKGVVPDASMVDIWKASVPFIVMGAFAMALVIAFPPLATWLPSFMR